MIDAMTLHIILDNREILGFNPCSLHILESSRPSDRYYKHLDRKWIKFCKDHNFSPTKDANGKIYNLYLDLCAEGII